MFCIIIEKTNGKKIQHYCLLVMLMTDGSPYTTLLSAGKVTKYSKLPDS